MNFLNDYEFIENYYSSKVILVHNQNHEIGLKIICENKYEIGIADPSRAPLGKLSSEILKGYEVWKNTILKLLRMLRL